MIKSTLLKPVFNRLLIMATSTNISRSSSSNSESKSSGEEDTKISHSGDLTVASHKETSSSQSTDYAFKKDLRETVKSNLTQRTFAGTPFNRLSKRAQKKLIQIHFRSHLKKLSKKTSPTNTTTEQKNEIFPSSLDRPSKLDIKKERIEKMLIAQKSGQKIAIDCSMEDTMSPKQLRSLAKQIRHLYSYNVRSTNPFHLYLTGLPNGGKLYQACSECFEGFDRSIPDITETSFRDHFDKDLLIYLTPDSPNDLLTLDPSKVYVLGGLVDSGDHWGFTYSNAVKMGISTAKLPIDRYMEKKKVPLNLVGTDKHKDVALTINQVFQMLIDVNSGKEWGDAMIAHLPVRKGWQLKTISILNES